MRDEVLGLINKLRGKNLDKVIDLEPYVKKAAKNEYIELQDGEMEYIINSLKETSKKPNVPLTRYAINMLMSKRLFYKYELSEENRMMYFFPYIKTAVNYYAREVYKLANASEQEIKYVANVVYFNIVDMGFYLDNNAPKEDMFSGAKVF